MKRLNHRSTPGQPGWGGSEWSRSLTPEAVKRKFQLVRLHASQWLILAPLYLYASPAMMLRRGEPFRPVPHVQVHSALQQHVHRASQERLVVGVGEEEEGAFAGQQIQWGRGKPHVPFYSRRSRPHARPRKACAGGPPKGGALFGRRE